MPNMGVHVCVHECVCFPHLFFGGGSHYQFCKFFKALLMFFYFNIHLADFISCPPPPIIWAICSSFTKFLQLTLCSLKFQPSFLSKINVISSLQLLSAEVKFISYISSFSRRHSLCFPGIDNICFLDDLIVLFTVVKHF